MKQRFAAVRVMGTCFLPPDIRSEWRPLYRQNTAKQRYKKDQSRTGQTGELYYRRYSGMTIVYMLIVGEEKVMTLEEVRAGIDAVDTQMKPLFLKRMECGNM